MCASQILGAGGGANGPRPNFGPDRVALSRDLSSHEDRGLRLAFKEAATIEQEALQVLPAEEIGAPQSL